MLSVCGVMFLLAALFLPALSRARLAADNTRCLSNLRQLGLATQLYWDDHGRTFAERTTRTNGGWRYWFGWLADGAEGEREFHPQEGPLWPYLTGRGVEICPSLNRTSPRFKSKARGAAFGYAYNLQVGPRQHPGLRPSGFRNPSSLALFTDGGQINDFQAPASPERPLLEEFYYFDTHPLSATVHFRHGHRAQVYFADGHVLPEPPAPGSEDRRLPPELCGRLREELVLP
jgi:prepilin-type processing-associated H-X9-DG protein